IFFYGATNASTRRGSGRRLSMNLKRLFGVWRLEVGQSARRPLFWILLLLNGFNAYALSTGKLQISSGDSSIGGTKVWITSEFATAQMLTVVVFLFYSFFVAVAAGMCVIHDDELKVGELLHATPLRPSEYVWGKFLGILSCFLVILLVQLLCMVFFNLCKRSKRDNGSLSLS